MTPCRYCGRERDDHIGIRETCPELPAQKFAPADDLLTHIDDGDQGGEAAWNAFI